MPKDRRAGPTERRFAQLAPRARGDEPEWTLIMEMRVRSAKEVVPLLLRRRVLDHRVRVALTEAGLLGRRGDEA